jgi:peptide/nickel transport system permease protein
MPRASPGVRFMLSRASLAVVTMVVLSVVTFAATNVVPADPARLALGKFAAADQIAAYRTEQGLDKPLVTRYVRWLGRSLQGDWGTSIISRASVRSEISAPLRRSAVLGLIAMGLAIPLAYVLGVYSGQRSGSHRDFLVSVTALFINSLPEFVVGLIMLVVFGVWLRVLPVESSGAVFDSGWNKARAYILPAGTLAIVITPYILRMVRANVRDVLQMPFVRNAALRGLPARRIIWLHVVPNASVPVVNVVALTMAELIGGAVVVETVFGFPGVGNLFVESVSAKDIPVVQAIALIVGFGFVGLNFAADAVIVRLNPRLRTP